ncbi:hypothetical protein Tco_1466612 [Tanacetum coccineum]
MTTTVEKRNANKFYEFHEEVGHNTDGCMHLRKHIEEMLKAGKLSHLVKEIKQNNEKEQPKVTKKGETVGKDKAMAILMVRPWKKVARQRITQSFSPNSEIFFPPLGEDEGTEGPMIIEAEIGGHCVHRQIQLLVTIGDEEHFASALMNFSVVRSPSPYNEIIGRPGARKLLVPLECAMVSGPKRTLPANEPTVEERIKVAINPEYPKQTIMIGSTLTEEGRNKLCSLLQQNLDVFTWKPAYMIGVPRHIAEHRLNVRKGCSSVRQKKRGASCRQKLGNTRRSRKVSRSMNHEGSTLPRLVVQFNNGKEARQQLEDVCRLYRLKQSMPKRRLFATENRLEGGVPVWIPF